VVANERRGVAECLFAPAHVPTDHGLGPVVQDRVGEATECSNASRWHFKKVAIPLQEQPSLDETNTEGRRAPEVSDKRMRCGDSSGRSLVYEPEAGLVKFLLRHEETGWKEQFLALVV
jgi:hypothetical protein